MTKSVFDYLISPAHVTYRTYFILIDLLILTIHADTRIRGFIIRGLPQPEKFLEN
jgi:hypothetical protein